MGMSLETAHPDCFDSLLLCHCASDPGKPVPVSGTAPNGRQGEPTMIRHSLGRLLLTTALSAGLLTLLPAREAAACGGFFCSQAQPVNQAAERIVFAQNDDDTVTAVIQILYEGPSEKFSWLLPIASVPDPESDEIAVSSDVAFQRLQSATNPQYTLTTRVEGTCKSAPVLEAGSDGANFSATSGGTGTTGGGVPNDGGVNVEASGVVGSFEWTVISFDPDLDDPADAAVTWLEANDFDVTQQGVDLIGPYLEDGLYLLALKLVKGADTGSIRPIVLTYDAGEPAIPIKLTAVAANNDMGVMTWLLGESRAVPQNYLSLELNEAQINWFNAAQNYNDVVTSAADESGGQGFVTEFAGQSDLLSNTIWSQYDEQAWANISDRVYMSFSELFDYTYSMYGGWDGFWDAVKDTVTLPDGVSFEDFKICPYCYDTSGLEFSGAAYLDGLEKNVIEPVRMLQDLFDSRPYATRLYTTMSAADMTVDPSFTFNADLDGISNIHTAERVIECNPGIYEFEAPWRIELPQGGVIRGTAEQANARSWPAEVSDQPANLKIRQLSRSGQGQLVTDNSDVVDEALDDYNSSLDLPKPSGSSSGSGGSSSADGGNAAESKSAGGGGGCAITPAAVGHGLWLGFGLLGLSLIARRHRRAGGRAG